MTATLAVHPTTGAREQALARAIDAACARIAPAWPLDRLIAVNPYWGFVEAPIEAAAATLTALSGTSLLMPREWYRARWVAGHFGEAHLQRAIALTGSRRTVPELVLRLGQPEVASLRHPLLTDIADTDRDLAHEMPWGEYVVRHVSQTCAACFDEGQARWQPQRGDGLYPLWRDLGVHDGGPRLLMGLRGFGELVRALPTAPRALIAEAVRELGAPVDACAEYFTALLLSVNGWASACAFRRWEARLAGQDDDQLEHLLAVRLAWEIVLLRSGIHGTIAARWHDAMKAWTLPRPGALASRHDDWVVHRALEVAYQDGVARALARPAGPAVPSASAQAVFCIDVRSEVFRRALEQVDSSIHTLGFAGFFGLPIAYRPLAGPVRPQLPGLLAPSMVVDDAGAARDGAVSAAEGATAKSAAWKELSATAGSAFSFVEAAGLGALTGLLRDGFALGGKGGDALRGHVPTGSDALRPQLAGRTDGTPLTSEERTALAAGILRAMSLTRGLAPVVALIGHGSSVVNNPQAAGLHCGACGGQTGELNARALAALLNDAAVREGLVAAGIDVRATRFVAGLHDTTTDDITLYDLEQLPDSHRPAIERLKVSFAHAGRIARRERAALLGLGDTAAADLDDAIRTRAADWSEVRPEWGLAGNAAFIVAPRARTRGIDLGGRSFLHEYRWEDDEGFGVLELIMTAPMIVTHWINMQYHASTVDNPRYGSGNKTLHNVVGGTVGVMEGAGGDLRIGLAMQSVHDGREWRHEPLRLTVSIEAPAEAIDRVLAKHAIVRQLVEGEWIFLHRIDADGTSHQRTAKGWQEVRPVGA